jgi:hypothetical protein
MTEGDHQTHKELAAQLRQSIQRLREDVEARGDPMLDEIARALEVILDLTTHAHDHALENRDRIQELARRAERQG